MVATEWLRTDLVLAGAEDVTVEGMRKRVAERMAAASSLPLARVEAAVLEAMQSEGHSVGNGVILPHVELGELEETYVCLVTLRTPLSLRTIDGKPVDVVIFILSKPDPHAHLLLLAHLARLLQSRTLLDGLRRSRTNEEVVQLIQAAEMRHQVTNSIDVVSAPRTQGLFVVSVGGEKVVDSLLVALVELGFGDGSVLEAQSLREATAREVPLFAGFRDLFGDPGGRRILVLEGALDRTEEVIRAVKRITEEHRSPDVSVSVLPLHTLWQAPSAPEDTDSPGH